MQTYRFVAPVLLSVIASCGHRPLLGASDGPPSPEQGSAGQLDGGQVDRTARIDLGPPRELKWTELGRGGSKRPAGRMNHFAVHDPGHDRLLVLGGYDPYKPEGGCCTSPYRLHSDVWQLDLATDTWSHVGNLEQPLFSFFPEQTALDAKHNRLVVVGAVVGTPEGPAQNLAIDLGSWKTTPLPAGPWGGEWPLRVAVDAARRRVVVHGAYSINKVEGIWTFDLDASQWTTISVPTPPPFRFHAPLCGAVAGQAFLFGGYDGESAMADLWQLDLDGKHWQSIAVPPGVQGRWSHRAVFDTARGWLAVFGGDRHGTKDFLETLLVDSRSLVVSEPVLQPSPSRRRDHTMTLDTKRRRALVYGGAFESKHVFDDAWALELP